MSLVATQGIWMPGPFPIVMPPALSATLLIDATGEKAAMIGRHWNKDRATKNIHKVGFQFGAVTKAGGSALTVSLQDVDTANGSPFQPDGTQDQTVAIANANAAFASNTWIQTGALSADRSCTFGELLAVVVEYDGGGRLGADSVVVNSVSLGASSNRFHQTGAVLFAAAAWTVQTALPIVILEYDDGTFGTLDGSWPLTSVSTIAFNSASAADEVALEFTLPFPCKIDGAWVTVLEATNTANFDIVLYKGTVAQATVSIDANILDSVAARHLLVTFPEVTYAVGDTFRLAVKPTTTTNVTLNYFDVNAANHFQAHTGGTSWAYTTRVDAGAWAAATTTRRPFAGIRISALDSGAGGSGMLYVPNLEGV